MQTVVAEGSVCKTAITSHGRKRLRREVANLRRLEQTGLVPRIIAQDASGVELEYIAGQSMADWLQLQPDWRAASSAAEVPAHLQAYVALEARHLRDDGARGVYAWQSTDAANSDISRSSSHASCAGWAAAVSVFVG